MGLAGLSASPAFLKGVKMELNIQTAELVLKEASESNPGAFPVCSRSL
jgi:hypothetical protein